MSSRMRGCGKTFQRLAGGTSVKSSCNSRHLCPSCKRILHSAEGVALGAEYLNNENLSISLNLEGGHQATYGSMFNDIVRKLLPSRIADRDKRIRTLEQELKRWGPTQPGQISSLTGHGYAAFQEEPDAPANTPGNWYYPFGCYMPPGSFVWCQKSSHRNRQLIKEHNAMYQGFRLKRPDLAGYSGIESSAPSERTERSVQATAEEVHALRKETEERIKEIQKSLSGLDIHKCDQDKRVMQAHERVNAVEARIKAIHAEGLGLGIGLEPSRRDIVEPAVVGNPRRYVDEEIIRFERRASSMGARLNQNAGESHYHIRLDKVNGNRAQQAQRMSSGNGNPRRRGRRQKSWRPSAQNDQQCSN